MLQLWVNRKSDTLPSVKLITTQVKENRHMKAFYSDLFELPLPEGHRFPMQKYRLLRERIVAEGIIPPENLIVPEAATDAQLILVHSPDYVHKVETGQLSEKEIRRMGFPWSLQLVERSRRSVGGTISACRAALHDGIAANLAGGTHHAFPDFGAGFCVFNDVAVAAHVMLDEGRAQRVVVIDCDVHQGDGTAAIFADDARVFTFSIHGARNFPFHKQQSDLDIELEDNTGDKDYLAALETGASYAVELAGADLAIYLAGADPFSEDRLGRLAVSKAGLRDRDRFVIGTCHEKKLPVAVVMSGGYARDMGDIVEIHAETVRTAACFARKSESRVWGDATL
jgi:acetoin utilization deacetylase AcuC-like enzyme